MGDHQKQKKSIAIDINICNCLEISPNFLCFSSKEESFHQVPQMSKRKTGFK